MRSGLQEPDAPRPAATSDAFLEPRQLLAPFFNMSKVGFGICDNQLRYQAINGALAASNRLPAEAHLGNNVRGVMGEVASEIESAFERVLVTRKPVLKEINGKIPMRNDVAHWIANYFPVKDAKGRVQSLGAIVVDVTEQRDLQESLRLLTQKLLGARAKEQRQTAQELHTSLVRYHATLKRNLSWLVRPIWQAEDRPEMLARSVALLDYFPVVSFDSVTAARTTFQQLLQNPKLREGFFARIGANPELQHEMLQVLSKHPEVQSALITKLARTSKFRRWLLRVAGKKM